VFLTIHILVYVITFVLCHHLYLDVCVCVHKYLIYQNCLYIKYLHIKIAKEPQISYCFTLKIKEGSSYLQENICIKFICHYNIDQNLHHTGKKELMLTFYFCHNKLTRQILYVVIYFFCKVFLTIHTLVYVITFVLCHHLYLDVCVCVHKY
jgi:hypothetical protein